ncbi:MAG: site-specific DNA-methyltransferase [Melioribacteraceae bacterium]
MKKKLVSDIIFNEDAREILNFVPKTKFITTTITSPPYFDMKDYGSDNQIGFGQSYEDYLLDLQIVFKNIFKVTKEYGSLWIIIDTFKKDGQVVPLPFDLVSKLIEVGWLLQDIIIWKKDKTVPWSSKGFMQRKFEYVLFFSKTKLFKYNKDNVRIYDTNNLKKWWVKYPERYNPKGKALDEVWEYPIPTQGSWGDKYIKHFCPLPTDMVGNMIQISTDERDMVMDPFAGSGSVLAQSSYMNRKYIGFELNKSFIKMFKNYLKSSFKSGKTGYKLFNSDKNQEKFESTILKLRSLKYAKVLRTNIVKQFKKKEILVFVKSIGKSEEKHKIIKVEYTLIGEILKSDTLDFIKGTISKAPLSKYGIEPVLKFKKRIPKIENVLYGYTGTNTYSFLTTEITNPKVRIISEIKVNLNENDF